MDLPQLDALVAQLRLVNRAVDGMAVRLSSAGATAGIEVEARLALREIAAWASAQHSGLLEVIEQIRRLDRPGGTPLGLSVRHTRHPAFSDPALAHRSALELVELLDRPTDAHLGRAADLLERFGGNPVFAATVLHRLGDDGMAVVLHRADRRWAEGGVDRAIVHGLAESLSTAMNLEISPLSWADLRRATGTSPTGDRSVGLLFTGATVFSTGALTAAVRALIVPWNREVRRRPATAVTTALAGGPSAVDVRSVVLADVAVDAAAARAVVATTDLDDLAAADLGYSDRGAAVADLLLAGTAPVDPITQMLVSEPMITGQRSATPLPAANLRKVIHWMAASGPPPLAVDQQVDRLLRSWIGSIRGVGLDGTVERHVRLDESEARSVLTRGMRFSATRNGLADAAWVWAGAESRRLASRPVAGPGFDAIGSVVGIISTEAHDARGEQEARADVERARQRNLWSQIQSTIAKPLPAPVRGAAGVLGGPLRDRVLADSDFELEFWAEHRDSSIGHDALAFEYLVLSTLWDRRRDNGYFDAVGGRPPASLVDRTGAGVRLRPLPSLDQAAVADYLSWRSTIASGRAAPIQMATERFFAEGREAPV